MIWSGLYFANELKIYRQIGRTILLNKMLNNLNNTWLLRFQNTGFNNTCNK